MIKLIEKSNVSSIIKQSNYKIEWNNNFAFYNVILKFKLSIKDTKFVETNPHNLGLSKMCIDYFYIMQ